MTRAQEFAHQRNWGKARIRGMNATAKSLQGKATEEEKKILQEIERQLILLETEWENYEKAKSELL